MPKYIFYFHDNKLQYVKKNEIKTFTFSYNVMLYGRVIHVGQFIRELKSFIKKEKINLLFSPIIRVICGIPFYNVDEELLLMAFNSLGINKIEFKLESEYYPKKVSVFLNILDTYLLKTTYKNNQFKTLMYPFNLFKDKKELLSVCCANKEESYLIFGTNQYLIEFVDILKNKNYSNVHYYNNYQTYLIEKALKN